MTGTSPTITISIKSMSSFALCQLDFTSCDFAQTPSLPSPFPFPPCRLSNATPPSIIIQCLLWAAKPRSPSDNLLKPAENNRLILGTLRQLIPLSSPSPNKVKTEEFDAVDKNEPWLNKSHSYFSMNIKLRGRTRCQGWIVFSSF